MALFSVTSGKMNVMQKKTFNLIIFALVAASIVMIGFASKAWYTSVYLDEERTFWASIENSLTIGSYSKTASSSNASQSIDQVQTVDFRGEVAVRNRIDVESTGEPADIIKVETLGFTDADYFRYLEISLADEQQNANAADAVDVWASNVDPEGSDVQLLLEAIASSFVMHGHFNQPTVDRLMSTLRNDVYDVDFANVARTEQNGRPVYVYRVTIDVSKFSKAFAQYVRELGKEELAQSIESQNYTSSSQVDISIDARSRTVISIVDVTASDGGEIFTGQGVNYDIVRPENTIPFNELQGRLDN